MYSGLTSACYIGKIFAAYDSYNLFGLLISFSDLL